jgi:hypothetical protein
MFRSPESGSAKKGDRRCLSTPQFRDKLYHGTAKSKTGEKT